MRELKEDCRLNRDTRTMQSISMGSGASVMNTEKSQGRLTERSEEAGGDSSMGRRDDGDGYSREVFKSGKNGRGETPFSVSVIQSRTETEREGGESWRGHLQRQCWAMWGALGAGDQGAGSLQGWGGSERQC